MLLMTMFAQTFDCDLLLLLLFQMEFLNEIGLFGESSSSSAPAADAFRKFAELAQNESYRLACIEPINTKFGQKLALRLTDEPGIFFLPARFQNLSQERKNEMVKLKENVNVIYRGERKFGAYKNTTPLIEFDFGVSSIGSSGRRPASDDTSKAAVALDRARAEEAEGGEEEEKPKKKKKKNHDS